MEFDKEKLPEYFAAIKQWTIDNPMGFSVLQCVNCRRLTDGKIGKCELYPDRIPDEVWQKDGEQPFCKMRQKMDGFNPVTGLDPNLLKKPDKK